MPPLPKAPGERRRRNAAQPKWLQLAADGEAKEAPPLPDGEWLESTRSWWETIWASPMAAAWLPADVPTLVRLAQLVDAVGAGEGSAALLAEIRQLEDRFGLSPKSRRQLQWEIASAEPAAGEQRPATARRLRAV